MKIKVPKVFRIFRLEILKIFLYFVAVGSLRLRYYHLNETEYCIYASSVNILGDSFCFKRLYNILILVGVGKIN